MLVLGLYILGGLFFLFIIAFIISSHKEREKYAVRKISVILPVVLLFYVPLLLPDDIGMMYAAASIIFLFCTGAWLVLPGKFPEVEVDIKNEEHDERLTLFSRYYELKEGNDRYQKFYAEFPHLKTVDDQLRSMPGLLSEKATFYEEESFAKARKYSSDIEQCFPLIDKNDEIANDKAEVNFVLKKELIQLAKNEGAVQVGFTQLKPYHFYTIKGRGSHYGKAINNKHTHAIAITVEMDKEKMDYAPYAPVIEESTLQYLRIANIATSLCENIRLKGYNAKAHIDQNYEVICPLVARDAGLGDIGRMGLLMTPRLGPHVRIAIVTTDMVIDGVEGKTDRSLQYFCSVCKKCATVCPSGAIPKKNMEKDGLVRYKIDHEKCFALWCKLGTDCGRCMQVCPYSHPDNWMHNLVRWLIKRNRYAALFALYADHFIYGKTPKPQKPSN